MTSPGGSSAIGRSSSAVVTSVAVPITVLSVVLDTRTVVLSCPLIGGVSPGVTWADSFIVGELWSRFNHCYRAWFAESNTEYRYHFDGMGW